MFRVMFEGSDERQKFIFENEDDAIQFLSMGVNYGRYHDYHFEGFDGCDALSAVMVDDAQPRPLRVSIMEVENEFDERKLFQRESK